MGTLNLHQHFQRLIPPGFRQQIWRLLTVVSLVLLGLGTVYAWREMPASGVQATPLFLVLAVAIYILTYGMHAFGWHHLATQFLGRRPFRTNLEAVAVSSLVKYLPTIAWYIASRVDFYGRIHVPRRLVVTASLFELVVMIGSGILFFVLGWLATFSFILMLLVLTVGVSFTIILTKLSMTERVTRKLHRRIYLEASDYSQQWPRAWVAGACWYAGTWLVGVLFLAAVLRTFMPVEFGDMLALSHIWVTAGLASYFLSVTLGSLGIAREITLTVLLAAMWPLPAAVMTAVIVKLVLTVGEIACSLSVLGYLHITRGQAQNE